jgi:hypothetical protein
MAFIHYTERNCGTKDHYWRSNSISTWEKTDLYNGSQSEVVHLNNDLKIPASAVVEVVCRNIVGVLGYYEAGVRSVGSDSARLFNIHEAEDGGHTNVSVFVQLDGDSCLETRSSLVSSTSGPRFSVVGYWQGARYTDLFETFTIEAEETWTNISLSGYGIPSGSIVEIACINTSGGTASQGGSSNIIGVREVGSVLGRTFDLHEPEVGTTGQTDDAREYCILQAQSSGESATVQVYAQHSGIAQFAVVGYWSLAPGEYTEKYFITSDATADKTWQQRDVNTIPGVPANATIEFQLTNEYPSAENSMGVQTGSGIYVNRFLDIHEAEPSGQHIGRMHTLVDNNGYIYIYHEDASEAHSFRGVGYWDDYQESTMLLANDCPLITFGHIVDTANSDLFIRGYEQHVHSGDLFTSSKDLLSSGIDLYIKVYEYNPKCHYIETYHTWTPSSQLTWEEKDLAAWVPQDEPNITAEIVMGTSGTVDTNYYAGIRMPGPNVNRYVNLYYAKDGGGYNTVTMHVQLSGTKIECYGSSGVDFFLLGYWIGTKYTQALKNFDPGTAGAWANKDLNILDIPSGAIAEIQTAQSWGGSPQGIRSVGNSTERKFIMDGGSTANKRYSFWTSFVQTSGDTSTIQYYVEYTGDWQRTYIAGWWENPPGDFVDVYQDDEANPSNDSTWELVNVSGVPSNSVASFCISNRDSENSCILGLRQSGIGIERKLENRESVHVARRVNLCWHVNVNSEVETYSEDATGSYDHFALLGYWENFNDALRPKNNNCPLFIRGYESYDVLDETEYPSGAMLYISGIPWGGFDCFIAGPGLETTSGTLWIHGPEQQSNSGTLFLKVPHRVGTSGISGAYPDLDVEYGGPSLDLFLEAPKQYTDSGNLFIKVPEPHSGSINLFIQAWTFNNTCHYIETVHEWGAASSGSWNTYNLHPYLVVPSGNDPSIVAEIMISNSGTTSTSGGIRAIGSSIDRIVDIFQKDNIEWSGAHHAVTMHVQLSADNKLECYAENHNNIRFNLLGYWVGPRYVETSGWFNIGAEGWIQKSLSAYGVASGATAEILAGTWYVNGQYMGARSVGSSLERYAFTNGGSWSDLPDARGFWSTFVNTSGTNAIIEVKGQYPDFQTGGVYWEKFFVAGYWSNPPGDYTERYDSEDIILTANNVWQSDSSSAPSGSVAQYYAGSSRDNKQIIGIRQSGSSYERKFNLVRREFGHSNFSVSVNINGDVITPASAEGYAQYGNLSYEEFDLFGYWNNFNEWPLNSGSISLYMSGIPAFISTSGEQGGQYPSGVSLYTYGIQVGPPCNLFIIGHNSSSGSSPLCTFGINIYRTDDEFSEDYPSGLLCYTAGSGIIPESGQFDLFICGYKSEITSGNLFTTAHNISSQSGDLFLKVIEPFNEQITLYIHNPIDPGSGLIREEDAIFYLSRRHHNITTSDLERIQNIEWDVISTIIGNESFLEQSGTTTTVGDGTLPLYNDMGGGFASCRFGQALVGNLPEQQNILGHVVSPSDYPYAGSGSITVAFCMSGAQTSGNVIEAGWLHRLGDFDDIGKAFNSHTVGIKITSASGLQVWTSVRDVPYEQTSSSGLWWGGTTHYGTPTDTDWTWRSPDEYWAWDEQWSDVNIVHDDVALFMVRSEFIASGIDGDAPNHMKVYLSVDGQPWVYIGSGLTGPPASSLYSYNDPRNRYAENAVGIKVQAINEDYDDESLCVNEIVLWTDSERFTNDELDYLYSTIFNYYRPLDEYKPTAVPPSTYIKRTLGTFTYDPTIIGIGHNPGEIASGLLVTLEVGLGAYGEDASAYLLEETPPSGFRITDISPTQITYSAQGSRPAPQQQIFHDPQSGIMQPYYGVHNNAYGANIRWINHNNHPEKDQRRSPTPTQTYTYKLYPIAYQGTPIPETFEFAGSGIFFNGSTGSGIFAIETTNDTSGTTSGLIGGIVTQGFDLYISGPLAASGDVNLYIRTQESFTSAYIGTSARTPELTDFIFAADGAAAIETLAGMEYGPPLYSKGPLQYEDSCSLVTTGPAGNYTDLFIHGWDSFSTSGDYPSGLLLRIGDGHKPSYGSGNLFTIGPAPYSGNIYLHTRAGAFEPPVDLFTWGYTTYAYAHSGFIKGPEFICSSGDFTYPLDYTLFTYPSGGKSPDFYIKGPEFICSSGSFTYPYDIEDFTYPYGDPSPTLHMHGHEFTTGVCPLYIGPLRSWENWILYLKTEDNDVNDTANLFIHGFEVPSGVSGINQGFNNTSLYLEAADADYPYTAGGTEAWTIFLRAQSGNLTSDDVWTIFLKADFTTPATCNLYTYGHASGEQPHGNVVASSLYMICSVNPDDPTRIGYTPFDSDSDPWTLFLRCDPGYFNTVDFYISGTVPTTYSASGNLFIEGLFEQEVDTISLYLMGISGLFNNGPSGLTLFLNANTLVYNTSGNLYAHGY